MAVHDENRELLLCINNKQSPSKSLFLTLGLGSSIPLMDGCPHTHNSPNVDAVASYWRGYLSHALFFTLFSFLFFFLSFTHNDFSISSPTSLSSQCTIVSTSVDLKSSKVCELGLLNYKAKNVFYPFERSRFRCRYDYYWASVFKVEYKELSSGQRRRALAFAPKEALPIDCRPSFGAAWLTKEKFKVNGTYNCRYTPGRSQVDIYSDSHFNCDIKSPSTAEMIRRYSILFCRILSSSVSSNVMSKRAVLESVGGIFSGMSSAFILVGLVKALQVPALRLARNFRISAYAPCIRRTCVLVAYLSIMGYLTIQYIKMLGITKLFMSFQEYLPSL